MQRMEAHQLFFSGKDGGVRANLSGANLSAADLSGANLVGARLVGVDLAHANLCGADLSTAEDLTEEHHAIERTASDFYAKEVEPNLDAIRHQEPGVAVRVLRKSAGLGLTAILIPERYGGMELDLASAIVAAESLGHDGS